MNKYLVSLYPVISRKGSCACSSSTSWGVRVDCPFSDKPGRESFYIKENGEASPNASDAFLLPSSTLAKKWAKEIAIKYPERDKNIYLLSHDSAKMPW